MTAPVTTKVAAKAELNKVVQLCFQQQSFYTETTMQRTPMKVQLGINDTSDGEVMRFVTGGLVVRLDSCETAYLHIGNLRGATSNARCDRYSRLNIGSTLKVQVTSAYTGSRGSRIEVREVSSAV
jgi:hypothetical protein